MLFNIKIYLSTEKRFDECKFEKGCFNIAAAITISKS
jgi:hypothetical protein